jgi:DNA uptake protein ComE-like DNA-binding protein
VTKAGVPQPYFDAFKNRVVLIDLNNASAEEMIKVLDGIGEARAAAVVQHRPYKKPEEIVSKAGVPQAVYDKFKDEVEVTPMKAAAAKRK